MTCVVGVSSGRQERSPGEILERAAALSRDQRIDVLGGTDRGVVGVRGGLGCLGLKSLGGLGVKRPEKIESLQGKLPRAMPERSSASVRNSSELVV
jgi:hypothetical protein